MAVAELAVEQRMEKMGEFAVGNYLAYLNRFAPNNLQLQTLSGGEWKGVLSKSLKLVSLIRFLMPNT